MARTSPNMPSADLTVPLAELEVYRLIVHGQADAAWLAYLPPPSVSRPVTGELPTIRGGRESDQAAE